MNKCVDTNFRQEIADQLEMYRISDKEEIWVFCLEQQFGDDGARNRVVFLTMDFDEDEWFVIAVHVV